jgi:glycosyltransferase involved in cell wall biosynthesis
MRAELEWACPVGREPVSDTVSPGSRVKRVVFITQQVDPGHPALAATVPKIRALAALVDEVVVLADGVVEGVLPGNCRVRTFRARTKVGRGLRFKLALMRELPRLRGGAVVAHMCPIYAVLAAPLVRPFGIPVVLWFTHWKASRLLRLAERFSTAVVSVDARSFPLASKNVHAIGHGIDLTEFACAGSRAEERLQQPVASSLAPAPMAPDGSPSGNVAAAKSSLQQTVASGDGLALLALGRYSRAKGLEVVVRAVAEVAEARLDVRGPALSDDEGAHRRELERLVSELGLGERVTLGEAVPRSEIPRLLAASDALVNNMRAGAPDKVVYEAGAGCVPVLASNPVFDTFLEPEQRFAREDPADLAERIRALAGLAPEERAALGRRLRERVQESHSVESWAHGVLEAAGIT